MSVILWKSCKPALSYVLGFKFLDDTWIKSTTVRNTSMIMTNTKDYHNQFGIDYHGTTILNGSRNCTSTDFICADGNCIPSAHRCDNFYDCRDFTDEQYCFGQILIRRELWIKTRNHFYFFLIFTFQRSNEILTIWLYTLLLGFSRNWNTSFPIVDRLPDCRFHIIVDQ